MLTYDAYLDFNNNAVAMFAWYVSVSYTHLVIAPNGLAYNIIEMREITNPLAAMQVSHNPVSYTHL